MGACAAPGGAGRGPATGQGRALAAHDRGWPADQVRDHRPVPHRQSALALARAAAGAGRGHDHRPRRPCADPAPIRRPAAAHHARPHPLRRGAVQHRSGRAGQGADPQGLDRGRLLGARGEALFAEIPAHADPRRSHCAPRQSAVGLPPDLGEPDAHAGAGRTPPPRPSADASAASSERSRQGDRGGARGLAQRPGPHVRSTALAPADAARQGRVRGAARPAPGLGPAGAVVVRARAADPPGPAQAQLRACLPPGQPTPADRGRRLRRGRVAGRMAGAALRQSAEYRAEPFHPAVRQRAGAGRARERRVLGGAQRRRPGQPVARRSVVPRGGGFSDCLLRPAGGRGAGRGAPAAARSAARDPRAARPRWAWSPSWPQPAVDRIW